MKLYVKLLRINIVVMLFILIILIFFIRGDFFKFAGFIPSVSPFIPVVSILLLASLISYLFIVNRNLCIDKMPYMYLSLFLFIMLNLLLNSVVHPEFRGLIFRFGSEMFLNLVIFYISYIVVRRNIVPIEKIFSLIQYGSCSVMISVFMIASALEHIRRIGARDANAALPTAVNHLGHSLAIVVIISLYKVCDLTMKRKIDKGLGINLLILIASLAAALLTGSKATLLSLLMFPILLFIFKAKYKTIAVINVLIIFALTLVIFLFPFGEKYYRLINRLSLEHFMLSIHRRHEVLTLALSCVEEQDLILGCPWRYGPINNSNPVVYPHNIAVSILIHTGFVPFIIFLYIISHRAILLFKNILLKRKWLINTALFSIFLTVLIYSFTSGRLTRIMTIFFALGVIEAYLKGKQ